MLQSRYRKTSLDRAYSRMIGLVGHYDARTATHRRVGRRSTRDHISVEDGFVQINYGQWVAEDHITWADVSEFSGVEITTQPKRPFAWMLAEAHPSRYPGGPQDKSRPKIERYTMLNIYGIEYVDGWEWYLVGPDQWIQQIRVAKVKPFCALKRRYTRRWIAGDLTSDRRAYEVTDGVRLTDFVRRPRWGTREGLFQIYERFEATA